MNNSVCKQKQDFYFFGDCRLKCQEDSNKIGILECQLKETRNQLSTLQSQHKSQLLEVSMLREEEKQNNNRVHQNLINKFKVRTVNMDM